MELFQLRYFESVVAHGSFTAAAEACHVSQPSLSAQIKSLEDELGVILLDRMPRGVTTTKAGARLLVSIRRILAETETVKRDLRRRRYHESAALRIGVQPFLASEVLPKALTTYLQGESTRQVEVQERSGSRLLEAVQNDEVDFGFMALPASVPEAFDYRVLFAMGYAAICPLDNPLAREKSTSVPQLLSQRLLVFDDDSALAEMIGTLAEQENRDPKIVLVSDQPHAIVEMACAGVGIAILPRVFEERALRRQLAVVPLDDAVLRVSVGAVWPRSSRLLADIEVFLVNLAMSHVESAAPAGLPAAAKEFLNQHVSSIEELELLLLLHREQERTWTADQMHGRLPSTAQSVTETLSRFAAAGVVRRLKQPDGAFQFAPQTAAIARRIDALALACAQQKSRVIEQIAGRLSPHIRGFADAFKLTPHDDR